MIGRAVESQDGQPLARNAEDAEAWIRLLHRRSISDIELIVSLQERVRWLELPWWRRIGRKRR